MAWRGADCLRKEEDARDEKKEGEEEDDEEIEEVRELVAVEVQAHESRGSASRLGWVV